MICGDGLAAFAEAGGEAVGEAGGEDAGLGGGKIVGDAVEGNGQGFGVIESEGGAPVVIAGLADGAGVDEVAGLGFKGKGQGDGAGGAGPGVDSGEERRAEVVPVVLALGEAALDVGVAEEGEGGDALLERGPGVPHGEDVVVLVDGRAVDAGDGYGWGVDWSGGRGRFDGALLQGAEPEDVVPGELVAGPDGGGAGDGVEGVG